MSELHSAPMPVGYAICLQSLFQVCHTSLVCRLLPASRSLLTRTAGRLPIRRKSYLTGVDMDNPVVLVTGALTGIGRAAAVAFAKKGANVVVAGRRDEAGRTL